MHYAYPFELLAQPEGGFTVIFPDVPEAITQGDTEDDAAANVSDVACGGGIGGVRGDCVFVDDRSGVLDLVPGHPSRVRPNRWRDEAGLRGCGDGTRLHDLYGYEAENRQQEQNGNEVGALHLVATLGTRT